LARAIAPITWKRDRKPSVAKESCIVERYYTSISEADTRSAEGLSIESAVCIMKRLLFEARACQPGPFCDRRPV
jgi:hypothetical protein